MQAESSSHRTQGGLGLGLGLVKGIAELHRGSVTVASDGIAKGCTVEIRFGRLPGREVLARQSATKTQATPVAPRRVLLVDDNADMTEMLAFALEHAGHATARAADGVEALQVAESFSPEVAFIDVGLPGLNGYEVGRRLRARLGGRVLLVAMSGYGQPEDIARSRNAGFDHHL